MRPPYWRPNARHKTITSLFPGVHRQSQTTFSVGSGKRRSTDDSDSFSCVGNMCHVSGAVTGRTLSLIRRRVGGMTRSTDDEASSADRAGTSATDVSKSEM